MAAVEYAELKEVSPGQIVVQRRDLYGVLNSEGRFTIPLLYNNITYLKDGKYMVLYKKKSSRLEILK